MNDPTRVTVNCRLSYLYVFKPRTSQLGSEDKFSATILVPKTDLAAKAAIDAAINAAIDAGVASKWNGVRPPQPAIPIHDGDGVRQDGTAFGPECKGHWVFTASANVDYPPQIVDRNLQPIMDQTQVYSGMYGAAAVRYYAYQYAGKKGIGCGLDGIMKIRDGEALGAARPDAAALFGAPAAATTVPQPPAQPQGVYQQFAPTGAPYSQAASQTPAPGAPAYIDPATGLPINGSIMGM